MTKTTELVQSSLSVGDYEYFDILIKTIDGTEDRTDPDDHNKRSDSYAQQVLKSLKQPNSAIAYLCELTLKQATENPKQAPDEMFSLKDSSIINNITSSDGTWSQHKKYFVIIYHFMLEHSFSEDKIQLELNVYQQHMRSEEARADNQKQGTDTSSTATSTPTTSPEPEPVNSDTSSISGSTAEKPTKATEEEEEEEAKEEQKTDLQLHVKTATDLLEGSVNRYLTGKGDTYKEKITAAFTAAFTDLETALIDASSLTDDQRRNVTEILCELIYEAIFWTKSEPHTTSTESITNSITNIKTDLVEKLAGQTKINDYDPNQSLPSGRTKLSMFFKPIFNSTYQEEEKNEDEGLKETRKRIQELIQQMAPQPSF